jgi:hypothetical protein
VPEFNGIHLAIPFFDERIADLVDFRPAKRVIPSLLSYTLRLLLAYSEFAYPLCAAEGYAVPRLIQPLLFHSQPSCHDIKKYPGLRFSATNPAPNPKFAGDAGERLGAGERCDFT